jgi:lipopolysaccharide transport system permease protein
MPELQHQTRPDETRILKVIRPPSFSFPIIISGLANLVRHLGLLYTMSMLRLAVRYKQSMLGWGWAALQPLALMLIYTAIFSRIARVPSDGTPYPVFVFTALLPWVYFSSAVSNAVTGLVNHGPLVMKVYFPREIIPLSYVAVALVDLGIAFCILMGLMGYYKVPLTWNALYAVFIIVILTAFAAAVALFLAAVEVRFRDVGMAIPLVLQIWMLATPVVYPLRSVPPAFRKVYLFDPVAGLIENFRRVVLNGLAPDVTLLWMSAGITILCLAAAYGYFKHFEATMADWI